MKNKFLLNFLLLFALLLASCTRVPATQSPTEAPANPTTEPTQPPASPTEEPVTLNVFAAASLTEAFTEIGAQFQTENPNVTVVFNFAGSQQLAQQINEGAPADVFASANNAQMNAAIEGGRIAPDTAQAFVTNRLVVIFPSNNPAGLATLQDLATPGLRIVLAAAEVPVGQYSLDFLDKAIQDSAFGASYKDDVIANVVSYEDNVRAVLTKVALGEADAGIVYSSDVSGESATSIVKLDIPDELNVLATYPIATITDSVYLNIGGLFVEFVLSPAGQTILANYGFIPVIEVE